MQILTNFNFGILFLVEVAMLVAFAMFGYALNAPVAVKWLAALALPTLVAVLWGMFFAPKASITLVQPWNAMGEYALFILAGAALIGIGHKNAGIALLIVAVLSETISLLPISR